MNTEENEKEDQVKEDVNVVENTIEDINIKDEDITHNKETIHDKVNSNIRRKKKKTFKIFAVITIVLLANVIILFGIISLINRFNTNVYKNVYVLDTDLSNLTSTQVSELLSKKSEEIYNNVVINVYQNDKEIYNINSNEIDFNIDTQKTTENVLMFGRDSNFVINNINIIKALIFKKEYNVEYIYDEEKLNNILTEIDSILEDRYSDDEYSIDEIRNTIVITRGKLGNSLDFNAVKSEIVDVFKTLKSARYNINVIKKGPNPINIEEIENVVKKEAKDAYIDTSVKPIKFHNEENGYKVDIEKLRETLNEEKNRADNVTIEFPLIVIEPKVKLADISYKFYKDKLTGYTTYFDASQTNRAKNLQIALSYLNGSIIMPGEVFSYYGKVGRITAEKGYLPAAVFKAGTIVNETGGGICQTSSTLYNIALMANLEIIERRAHGLPVGYVPPSRDATIYGNILDFKFRNTRNYPIKIVTSFSSSGSMNISLYGTKEEKEYDITISSKVLYYIPFTTRYTYDQNMPEGSTSIAAKGVNGYASEAYITKKLNGRVVSSGFLSRDVYKAQQQHVIVGKKQVQNETVDIYQ